MSNKIKHAGVVDAVEGGMRAGTYLAVSLPVVPVRWLHIAMLQKLKEKLIDVIGC